MLLIIIRKNYPFLLFYHDLIIFRRCLLRRATTVPQRVKDRAEAVRLNARGWYVEKIAAHLNWTPQTVRLAIHRWRTKGLGGLWEAVGRGGKARWQQSDIAYLQECLEQEPRT